MLHVVLDTNVVFSGLRSQDGVSFRLLRRLDNNEFSIDISVPLVMEYHDVIMRGKSRIQQDPDELSEFVDSLCEMGNQYEIFFLWRPGMSDPKDEHLLELAVRARSDGIVTFNVRHFDGAARFGIPVLTPLQFMELLGV